MTQEEIKRIGIEHLITRDLGQDPKYRPIQGRLLHIEKNYLIPTDEPVYVTRADDPTAVELAKYYFSALEGETQSNIVVDHMKTSTERVEVFELFAEDNCDMVGNLSANLVARKNNEIAALVALNTSIDSMQSSGYLFWDFSIFDRANLAFVSEKVPLMIYRGKDALLVQIIDKHIEMLDEAFNNGQFEHEDDYDLLTVNAENDKLAILEFHQNNPERVGVTCSLFSSQEAKGDEYKKAMANAKVYAKMQKEQDGKVE